MPFNENFFTYIGRDVKAVSVLRNPDFLFIEGEILIRYSLKINFHVAKSFNKVLVPKNSFSFFPFVAEVFSAPRKSNEKLGWIFENRFLNFECF